MAAISWNTRELRLSHPEFDERFCRRKVFIQIAAFHEVAVAAELIHGVDVFDCR